MDNKYIIYCDGLCEPTNPNGYACWAFVVTQNEKVIYHNEGCVGHGEGMTNNIAEYHSLLNALLYCFRSKVFQAQIRMDSQLVVNQVNGDWKCNKESLRQLLARCARGMEIVDANLTWIPREQNEIADKYSRVAYNKSRAKTPSRQTLATTI